MQQQRETATGERNTVIGNYLWLEVNSCTDPICWFLTVKEKRSVSELDEAIITNWWWLNSIQSSNNDGFLQTEIMPLIIPKWGFPWRRKVAAGVSCNFHSCFIGFWDATRQLDHFLWWSCLFVAVTNATKSNESLSSSASLMIHEISFLPIALFPSAIKPPWPSLFPVYFNLCGGDKYRDQLSRSDEKLSVA